METLKTPLARPVIETGHPLPLSIRLLRRLEPAVAALLRSPFHGLLSRDVLLLTYRGRKTGRSHTLPLSYVEMGDRLYLCTRPEGSRWWRNLRDRVPVSLRLRGKSIEAEATILDPASPGALAGLRAFVARNPGTGKMLYHISPGSDGEPSESDLAGEVARSVVVEIAI